MTSTAHTPDHLLYTCINGNGSVFLDQHHNHHENNDNNLINPGNRTETLQEPLEEPNEGKSIFDFFFLNQDNDDYSTQEAFKEDVKETSEDNTEENVKGNTINHKPIPCLL
jgi:hypothetical protein